jgi:hypothetical protein
MFTHTLIKVWLESIGNSGATFTTIINIHDLSMAIFEAVASAHIGVGEFAKILESRPLPVTE